MILFWLIGAVLVAIALAFVIPPLLQRAGAKSNGENKHANVAVYRDQIAELESDVQNGMISQEQFQQDRDEIERRLLDDVAASTKVVKDKTNSRARSQAPVYALALGIPVIAVAMYLRVGDPGALSGTSAAPVQPPFAGSSQSSGPRTQADIETNVAALAKRMEQNPGDAQGWIMLGRSYVTLERYAEATNAYAKASSLKPDDADLLADYAFAMGMANGKHLDGRPLELVEKALEIDPENAKALQLAGSAAYEAKDYTKAISYWKKLLQRTPADSPLARELTQSINEAKSLGGTEAR